MQTSHFVRLVLGSLFALPAPALAHLTPGADLVLTQTVDVNVVLAGFPTT